MIASTCAIALLDPPPSLVPARVAILDSPPIAPPITRTVQARAALSGSGTLKADAVVVRTDWLEERVLDAETMALLDRVRWDCGIKWLPASECLPPEIELDAISAFRSLADCLEDIILDLKRPDWWVGPKPAAAREMAEEYRRARGNMVLITSPNSAWRASDHVSASTVRAVEYLIRQNNPEGLQAWLAKHTRQERAAVKKYFERKGQ
jgi:hypothetical protein